jgi:hypothetical protein
MTKGKTTPHTPEYKQTTTTAIKKQKMNFGETKGINQSICITLTFFSYLHANRNVREPISPCRSLVCD